MICKASLIVIFTALLFGAPDGTATNPFPLYRTPTARLVWDAYPAGTVLRSVTIQFSTSQTVWTAPLLTYEYLFPTGAPQTEIRLSAITPTPVLPDGIVWARVCVTREDFAISPFSAPLAIRVNNASVGAPGGCALMQ